MLSAGRNGVEMEYMTLEMHYQEKYEEGLERGLERGLECGIEQGATKTALKMLESGKLSMEEIAEYSGLALERVKELGKKVPM